MFQRESALQAATTTPRIYDGWFATAVRLVVGDGPRDGWKLDPGDATVIVLYSSQRARDAYDKSVFNDELVIEVRAADVRPGAPIQLAACHARYQRGSTKLEYVSRRVTGELQLDAADARELRGRFTLSAGAPELDALGLGDTSSAGTFQIALHKP